MFAKIKRTSKCVDCYFCDYFVKCPGIKGDCLGCGICVKGCPEGARSLYFRDQKMPSTVNITIDGERYSVPARITIEKALELTGKEVASIHNCGSGGCFNCAVLVDGNILRSCCTEVQEGMEIVTEGEEIKEHPPLRIVSLFPNLHGSVVIFTHGCNFNCNFCHNWNITFSSTGRPQTPHETAHLVSRLLEQRGSPARFRSGNLRVGISGGEPTINRRWLVGFVGELKARYEGIRIQLDTNASLLNRDYLEELCEAGVTDISPDLKGLELDTFIKITGIENRELACKYHKNIWQNIEYIITEFASRLYFTIGLPYHPDFITQEELYNMGKRLAALNKNIDVNLIIYQPAFRMRKAKEVADEDIDRAMSLLNDTGLRVWCQEGEDIPKAVDPMDLILYHDLQ